ncbi:MAG: hypothetical protein ACYDAI_01330, partial [Trichloromonadaceae bacterium]
RPAGGMRRGVDDRQDLSQPANLISPPQWNRLGTFTEKLLHCRYFEVLSGVFFMRFIFPGVLPQYLGYVRFPSAAASTSGQAVGKIFGAGRLIGV